MSLVSSQLYHRTLPLDSKENRRIKVQVASGVPIRVVARHHRISKERIRKIVKR